ncbi:hypothetical protein NX059_012436 [Plenodomus lindquistii]|nr:hypothetical protein NX059_012436 [Plenodomus lindquistii]
MESAAVTDIKWVFDNTDSTDVALKVPPDKHIKKSAEQYFEHAPLSVYHVMEATYHSDSNDFWKTMFPTMKTILYAYAILGIIECNFLILRGTSVGNDGNCTPQSKVAGWIRLLVAGTFIWIMTLRIIEIAW